MKPLIDMGLLEQYVLDQVSGNIKGIASYIRRLSLVETPWETYYDISEEDAKIRATSLLESLADDGKIRLFYREVEGNVPVFEVMG